MVKSYNMLIIRAIVCLLQYLSNILPVTNQLMIIENKTQTLYSIFVEGPHIVDVFI